MKTGMKSLVSENGRPSGTKALLSLASLVVIARLALADVRFAGEVIFPSLDWSGCALILGTLATLYGARRATETWGDKFRAGNNPGEPAP